jgi:hypothetical protein
MHFILHPWHIVLLALSALVNRERDKALEYLVAENQVLREKLGKGRIFGACRKIMPYGQKTRPNFFWPVNKEYTRDSAGNLDRLIF